jgi:hypothetical protein
MVKKGLQVIMLCLFFLPLLFVTDAEAAAALDKLPWYNVMGQAQSNDLQDVAVNKSEVYVAVGDEGTLLYSGDAREWKQNHLAGSANLKEVATDGQRFVAVGEKGSLLTSPDGYTWTNHNPGKAFALGQLTPAGDQKDYNKDYTIKWNTPFQPQWLNILSVIWDGKRFVAIGRWEVTIGVRKAGSKQEDPSATVRGHVLLTSSNGSKWEIRPSTFAGRKLVFGGGKYIAIADRTLTISTDLVKWTYCFPDVMKTRAGVGFEDMIYANGAFTAIGWDGNLSFRTGTVYTSKDGFNWKEIKNKKELGNSYKLEEGQNPTGFTDLAIRSIMWDGKQYWITGYKGTVLRSATGTEWEDWGDRESSQNPFNYENWAGIQANINKMIYDGNRYLMVGNRGTIIVSKRLTKAEVVRQRTPTDFTQIIYDGGKRYVARGLKGDIFESQDGYQWKKTELNEPDAEFHWSGFAFGEGVALAVGYDSSVPKGSEDKVLLSSASPGVWEKRTFPVKLSSILNISFLNGKFYLFGWEGYYTSSDGFTWSKLIRTNLQINNIGSNGKVFLGQAALSTEDTNANQLFISLDGVKWKPVEFQLNNEIHYMVVHHIQWTGKQFIATSGFTYPKDRPALTNSFSSATSINGSIWTFNKNGQGITNFVSNGKQFVGLEMGSLYTSEDGVTYNTSIAPTGKEMQQIIWDGEKFIAVGRGGTILVSKKPPVAPLPWTEVTEAYSLHYDDTESQTPVIDQAFRDKVESRIAAIKQIGIAQQFWVREEEKTDSWLCYLDAIDPIWYEIFKTGEFSNKLSFNLYFYDKLDDPLFDLASDVMVKHTGVAKAEIVQWLKSIAEGASKEGTAILNGLSTRFFIDMAPDGITGTLSIEY